jgi:predicted nucleic acid-binding Zn ribbon protein
MANDSFRPLSHYLQVLLDERGLRGKLEEARLPELFRQIVGETVWRRIEAVTFQNGELLVHVHSPIWRIELRLRAENIRTKLNERFGHEIVRHISIL